MESYFEIQSTRYRGSSFITLRLHVSVNNLPTTITWERRSWQNYSVNWAYHVPNPTTTLYWSILVSSAIDYSRFTMRLRSKIMSFSTRSQLIAWSSLVWLRKLWNYNLIWGTCPIGVSSLLEQSNFLNVDYGKIKSMECCKTSVN